MLAIYSLLYPPGSRPIHRFPLLFWILILCVSTGLTLWVGLLAPPLAHAADTIPVDEGRVAAVNLYVVALGGLTPLVVYLLNYLLPQTSEQAKGVVQAVCAAGVGVLVGAVTGSDFGLNDATLLNAATAMISAALAHFAYKAPNINSFLGGGLNRQRGDRLFVKT